MGYRVIRAGEHSWDERAAQEGERPRRTSNLTDAAGLVESRARLWDYPPHTRGRRHKEGVQEEVFVVLSGTLTLLLGEDPIDRVDLPPQSVVSVEPGTGIQMRNETDEDVMVFVYGSPPVTGQAEYLDDVEL